MQFKKEMLHHHMQLSIKTRSALLGFCTERTVLLRTCDGDTLPLRKVDKMFPQVCNMLQASQQLSKLNISTVFLQISVYSISLSSIIDSQCSKVFCVERLDFYLLVVKFSALVLK